MIETPAIEEVGGVEFGGGIRDGEGYGGVAAIVGVVNKALEGGAEVVCVEAGDCAVDSEAVMLVSNPSVHVNRAYISKAVQGN